MQKDAKLIFISSSNTSDDSTSFLLKLKTSSERMLNIVNYVCVAHMEDFSLQETLIACPCYRLMIPTFITIDESIKTTTNLIMDGVFDTELVGDSFSAAHASQYRIITDTALSQLDLCRIDTSFLETETEHSIVLYVDPAYSNNTAASGTGVAALGFYKNKRKMIILGLEHFFLKDLTGAATVQIAMCVASMIKSIVCLHPWITEARISVEGNSSQDSAVAISTVLAENCPIRTLFAHHRDKNGMRWPIYLLGQEKAKAFQEFIYCLNSGQLLASQIVVSNTIKLNFDPVGYLIDQIRGIKTKTLQDGSQTFSAKQPHLSDDTLVALVMAVYLHVTEHLFIEINSE